MCVFPPQPFIIQAASCRSCGDYQPLSYIPNIAILSHTSTIPQNDLGNSWSLDVEKPSCRAHPAEVGAKHIVPDLGLLQGPDAAAHVIDLLPDHARRAGRPMTSLKPILFMVGLGQKCIYTQRNIMFLLVYIHILIWSFSAL